MDAPRGEVTGLLVECTVGLGIDRHARHVGQRSLSVVAGDEGVQAMFGDDDVVVGRVPAD